MFKDPRNVERMLTRFGNPAKDQFILHFKDYEVFKSYNSIVAVKHNNGRVVLDERTWNYSATTRNYRNSFLGEFSELTNNKIAKGEHMMTNLNKRMDNAQKKKINNFLSQKKVV